MNSFNLYNSYDDRYLRKELGRAKNFTEFVYNNNPYLNNYYFIQERAMNQNYPYYIPDNNLNYFPSVQPIFIQRPVKYFFQKQIQLNEEQLSPNNKEELVKLKEHNKVIKNLKSHAKWGIPMKMEDILTYGDDISHPNIKLLHPDEIYKIKNDSKINRILIKQKLEQEKENQETQRKIQREKREKIRMGNKKFWIILRRFRHILRLYKIIKQFTSASLKFKKNKYLVSQTLKEDLIDLTNFMKNSIKSIEELAINYFTQQLVFDSNLPAKTDDSIFRIKTFIHQILYDLTNITKNSIPRNIKIILLKYISEGAKLPEEFLSTFEFNRLEFDLDLKLFNMRLDRQSMLVCFILLYRILLMEILMNYKKHFKKLVNVDPPTKEIKPTDDIRLRILGKNNMTKDKVQDNIGYNFSFIWVVLKSILKSVFNNYPKIYTEYFKEVHLYQKFVIDGSITSKIEISEKIEKDLIEFAKKFPKNDKAEEFLKAQSKWINMHQITILSFCMNLVENILT